MQIIVVLAVLIYFIHAQFKFETVGKITYFFLPIFSIYQLVNHFSASTFNLIGLLVICVFSIAVGFYQAKNAIIRKENVPVYFYKDSNGNENTVYKKVVKVCGGVKYLIGWLVIFALQLVLQIIYAGSKLDSQSVISDLFTELIDDMTFVFRFIDLDKKGNSWYVWALYGISSMAYTYFLAKRSYMVREVLFPSEENEYELEYTGNKKDLDK